MRDTPRTDGSIRHVHELKCWPEQFDAIHAGKKFYEWRRNDRDFRVGDTLLLFKYDPVLDKKYSDCIIVEVTSAVFGGSFDIPMDYCVLGIHRRERNGVEYPEHAAHFRAQVAESQLTALEKESAELRQLASEAEASIEANWDSVIHACKAAWPDRDKLFYNESPIELITEIVNDLGEQRQRADELRRSCAQLLDADPETWPDHGNWSLAIAAGLALTLEGFRSAEKLRIEAEQRAELAADVAMEAAAKICALHEESVITRADLLNELVQEARRKMARDCVAAIRAQISNQQAVAAVMLDAERYRKLRASHLQTGPDAWIRSGDDLDDAVDALPDRSRT